MGQGDCHLFVHVTGKR